MKYKERERKREREREREEITLIQLESKLPSKSATLLELNIMNMLPSCMADIGGFESLSKLIILAAIFTFMA